MDARSQHSARRWTPRGAAALAAMVIAAALGASASSRVRADPPAQALVDAREVLSSYDDTSRVIQLIERLGRFLVEPHPRQQEREARFLRAVAATDLLIISRGLGRDALQGLLADALGVPEVDLFSTLRGELARLDVGVYAEVAGESRWALDALERRHVEPSRLRDGQGERRDVMYVHAVVDTLGAPDEVARLAALGADPCEDPRESCGLPFLTSQARRAVSALQEAHRAMTRLEALARTAEPLIASLAGIVTIDGTVLRTSTIRPTPMLPVELGVRGVGARGREARPDVIVILSEDALRYAHVSDIQVRDGEVHFVSAHEPALPSWGRVPFRSDGRAAVAPFDRLAPTLARIARAHPERVGLAVAGDVDALTVSRVLLTMSRAGLPAPELLSRGPSSEARSVPIELAMGDDREPTPLALFVRLGGYTLSRSHGSIDIPRVRADDGLHFDLATLEERAREAGAVPASLRYMGVVPWAAVLDAAFRLRSEPAPLSLVLY